MTIVSIADCFDSANRTRRNSEKKERKNERTKETKEKVKAKSRRRAVGISKLVTSDWLLLVTRSGNDNNHRQMAVTAAALTPKKKMAAADVADADADAEIGQPTTEMQRGCEWPDAADAAAVIEAALRNDGRPS